MFLENKLQARLKTIIKSDRKTKTAKCFYLTQDSELHIIPKSEEIQGEGDSQV
jgi:hypothetical protein